MMVTRCSAVAGSFYPESPDELRQVVKQMLTKAPALAIHPKALIAPHAGYIYSGPTAAVAYNSLRAMADQITRVVLLGPAHRVPLHGIATSGHSAFETPLGRIPIDLDAIAKIAHMKSVTVDPEAHRLEHSLEVQLPFLQMVLGEFFLVPLVVGAVPASHIAQVLNVLWGGAETLIVVSSDLSHYHPYDQAKVLDKITTHQLEELIPDIHGEQACGSMPINGLLLAAQQHGLKLTTLDLRSSGDTAGDRHRVVGYGAYALQ